MSTSPGRQRIMAKIVPFNSNAPKKPTYSFVAVCNYTLVGLFFRKFGADDYMSKSSGLELYEDNLRNRP